MSDKFLEAAKAQHAKARAVRDLRRRQLADAEAEFTQATDTLFALLENGANDA